MELDYKREAIELLKSYYDWQKSIQNMTDELRTINSSITAMKTVEITDMPQGRSSINYDDRINNLIFRKGIVEKNLKRTYKEVQIIDQILKGLEDTAKDDREKKHAKLLRCWFIEGSKIEDMMKEFICSKTELYRLRDDAVKRFAKQRFGLPVVSA
jgi:predicted  nucleic acid-binding Zn-ribbon protein